MALMTRIGNAMDRLLGPAPRGFPGQIPIAPTADLVDYGPSEFYQLLRHFYYSNHLYDWLARASFEMGLYPHHTRGLRNPTFRVVEFYVAKIWGGSLNEALPIEADNAAIIEPIEQIWTWSNWSARKQTAARSFAMLGDLYLKVAQSNDQKRVYLQRIEPDYVTDFDTDERGFLTWIRVDTPQQKRDNGQVTVYTHTEVWDKAAGTQRIWEHQQGATAALEQLGIPDEQHDMSEFGINFVPFVHAPFRDVGEKRGMAAITPAIDKIDEANKLASRLHQLQFRHNQPTWALAANAVGPDGRPMPPPLMSKDDDNGGSVTVGDEQMVTLPGMTTLQPLIPNVNYAAALDIMAAHLKELERDLPELAYYSLGDSGGNPSGVSLRYILTDAVDRVIEARGNAEAALIRANQMALTIAASNDLPGFTNLGGTFESGAFEHTFAERDVIPLSALEEAQAEQAKSQAAVLQQQAGFPPEEIFRVYGYSEDKVAKLMDEQANAANAQGGALLDALNGKVTPGQVPAPNGATPPTAGA